MNPQMFNSFLDGTKSAIEMVAIANACGLDLPRDGLAFPPCGVDDLAHILRPRSVGGQLDGLRHGRGHLFAGTRRAARCSATCVGASTWS
jgi:predicted homoserine dehydrogenase-like protein